MIGQNSRNLLTSVVEVVDPITGELVKPSYIDLRQRVTSYDVDDRFVAISSDFSWGSLSRKYLGDARHWWVIADLSKVIDPFTEFVPGQALRVPSPQRLFFGILPDQSTST